MRLNDYGCMLRGYHRDVVDVMSASDEASTFIPALAQQYARRPIEIPVAHAERTAGESKYSLYKLVRLNFDLMTGFSVVPLQLFTLFGFVTALVGLRVRRLPARAPARRRRRGGGRLHALRARLRRHGRPHGRDRDRGRIRGPHLPAGARAPALPDPESVGGLRVEPFEGKADGRNRRLWLIRDVGYNVLNDALLDAGESVRVVYTHDDVPGEERWFDSVAELARTNGIEPRRVANLDDPLDEKSIRGVAPDFLFSFYFRAMIPGRILALARRGALNMHGSLLPAFRGRSPVNWAILKGATETGASLHYMTEKPDAGDLVDQERVPIGPEDDALTVSRRVADAAALVLARSLPHLKAGDAAAHPARPLEGILFRRPQARGRPHRLDAAPRRRSTTSCAPSRSRGPAPSRTSSGRRSRSGRRACRPHGGHDVFPGKVELTERSVIVFAGDDRTVEILAARPEGGPDLDAGGFHSWLLSSV